MESLKWRGWARPWSCAADIPGVAEQSWTVLSTVRRAHASCYVSTCDYARRLVSALLCLLARSIGCITSRSLGITCIRVVGLHQQSCWIYPVSILVSPSPWNARPVYGRTEWLWLAQCVCQSVISVCWLTHARTDSFFVCSRTTIQAWLYWKLISCLGLPTQPSRVRY